MIEEAILSLSTLEEAISSSPAPPVIVFSSEDEPTNKAGIFRATPATLKLEASILENYQLVHELFIKMLLTADATKLLAEPCRKGGERPWRASSG